MSTAKNQECFESDLQNLNCDIQKDDKNDLENGSSEIEKDDMSHDEIEGNIIMDADGNYYYQSSKSMVKVEPLPKIAGTPIKKVSAFVIPQIKQKSTAESPSGSVKKSKLDISEVIILKYEDGAPKNADETINSEADNQDKIYEFDETEQDPDDPEELANQDYETKAIIIAAKKQSTLFSCMICSYQTNKKFLLSRHLKIHCDERPYKCDVCERGFKTNAALMNHHNIHLGRKPHACSSCDMAFTTSGELVRHVRYRHTHIKPHKCTECDYSSVEMSKLRRHIRCHTGERPYQCPHCTYASPDTFKLKRHMRVHTGEKPYECDICHARFTQSNSLKHHRLIHSVSEKPVFQCNLCPTTCGRKTDLRLHMKNLHSSDQPIPCKRCGKELPDRYSYKMHIKTHEGEKCFRCEYCPYASISRRHLESHVLIHLDEKPFQCDICLMNFRQKQLLTRHEKIYHSEGYEPPKHRKKDNKCPHCDKMFAFVGNLMRHMETHDPDSQQSAEKNKLKLGRLKRVKADGTVVSVTSSEKHSNLFDENVELSYDENEEEQQIDDEEMQEEVFEEAEVYNGEDNIQYVYDESEAGKYQEQIEEVQYEEQQEENYQQASLINVKQENVQPMLIDQTSFKKEITVKDEEKSDTKIVVLEDQDEQGFMVIEVLSADDNDEQHHDEHDVRSHETKPIIINKRANASQNRNTPKKSQPLISDYFGFEVDAEEDEETKGAIKILEMIEQD